MRPPRKTEAARKTRGERGAGGAVLALSCVLLVAMTLAPLGACSEPAPAGSTSPSVSPAPPSSPTVEDAFGAAHPGGALPPGLRRVGDASRAAELLAAHVAADRILLPRWLPPGYGLASPYVAVGSGAVLPNPYVWNGGYRVSYTDGRGLVVVHVGAGRLPGEGVWRSVARTWRGATARMRVANGLMTIASREGALPVAVAVAGVPTETAYRVIDSLRR